MHVMARIGFGTERSSEATQPWDLRLLKRLKLKQLESNLRNLGTQRPRLGSRPDLWEAHLLPRQLGHDRGTTELTYVTPAETDNQNRIGRIRANRHQQNLLYIHRSRVFLRIADCQMRHMCFCSRW